MPSRSIPFPTSLIALLSLVPALSAADGFGLEKERDRYVLDSGNGLTVAVSRSSGDIRSIVLHGTELQANNRFSHISSGLGKAKVRGSTIGGKVLRIEIGTDTLTHYLFMREGVNVLYMATHITRQPRVGELRFIARLNSSALPESPPHSDLRGTTGAVESKDVFGKPDGTTRSKYYGNSRAKDLTVKGATGDGVGVFVDFGSRERASGGPFFRDIENQHGEKNEIYNYMNSGHNQTGVKRIGLHGPYAYIFTDGSVPPASLDYSWMDDDALEIEGWTPASRRGSVTCPGITNRKDGFEYTVGFSNEDAQYWANASPEDGSFTLSRMIPGTYRLTVYKGELEVHTGEAKVMPRAATRIGPLVVDADPDDAETLWRIGRWDGSPAGFLNADKVTVMHPGDSRIDTWTPGPFVIGSSDPATGMPCYQWKNVNGSQDIRFGLGDDDIRDVVVRIGITAAFAGGRPNIRVNSWESPLQKPSDQPRSRSLTIGTYRGNNRTYEFHVPAKALKPGANTISIHPVSGSGSDGFLSASYSFDCIDMIVP